MKHTVEYYFKFSCHKYLKLTIISPFLLLLSFFFVVSCFSFFFFYGSTDKHLRCWQKDVKCTHYLNKTFPVIFLNLHSAEKKRTTMVRMTYHKHMTQSSIYWPLKHMAHQTRSHWLALHTSFCLGSGHWLQKMPLVLDNLWRVVGCRGDLLVYIVYSASPFRTNAMVLQFSPSFVFIVHLAKLNPVHFCMFSNRLYCCHHSYCFFFPLCSLTCTTDTTFPSIYSSLYYGFHYCIMAYYFVIINI